MTYSVEIEVDGLDLTELNMTEIQITISNLTGIETDKLRIRVDINDKNDIVHIIVIVDDEETADRISTSINDAIDEHNEEGIVRHFKRAKVVMEDSNLSISNRTTKGNRTIAMLTIVFMTFIIQNHVW